MIWGTKLICKSFRFLHFSSNQSDTWFPNKTNLQKPINRSQNGNKLGLRESYLAKRVSKSRSSNSSTNNNHISTFCDLLTASSISRGLETFIPRSPHQSSPVLPLFSWIVQHNKPKQGSHDSSHNIWINHLQKPTGSKITRLLSHSLSLSFPFFFAL